MGFVRRTVATDGINSGYPLAHAQEETERELAILRRKLLITLTPKYEFFYNVPHDWDLLDSGRPFQVYLVGLRPLPCTIGPR